MLADPKPFSIVHKPIRQLPGQEQIECNLRLPGCEHLAACLCHVRNVGALGGNRKPHDPFGFYGCNHCHRLQEARQCDPWDVIRAIYEAQTIMFQRGLLRVGEPFLA